MMIEFKEMTEGQAAALILLLCAMLAGLMAAWWPSAWEAVKKWFQKVVDNIVYFLLY